MKTDVKTVMGMTRVVPPPEPLRAAPLRLRKPSAHGKTLKEGVKVQAALLLTIVLPLASCTSVLVATTGDRGIVEDPSRRTFGARVEDEVIEEKVKVNLRSQEPAFNDARFQVYSHNGTVLLVGQVESQQLKTRATDITGAASAEIKRVHNWLEVSNNTTFVTRTNDAVISTSVNAQLLLDSDIPSVRVIVENGTVYLMGIVTYEQGESAAQLAMGANGVQGVVKVFEYIE